MFYNELVGRFSQTFSTNGQRSLLQFSSMEKMYLKINMLSAPFLTNANFHEIAAFRQLKQAN
jgi:hypothetical protein